MADDRGDFFFLEMNTRLQVEHPVTEETTGPRPRRAAAARRRRRPPRPRSPAVAGIFDRGPAVRRGPGQGWQPQAGTVHRFEVPRRTSASTPASSTARSVSVFYDPMIAKVISYASDRRQAAGVLADALARTRIHGVRTNRDLLVNVLRHPRLPRRRHRHRVLRHPRPGRAGRTAGRPTRQSNFSAVAAALADAAQNRQDRNGVHRGAQRLAQPRVGLPDRSPTATRR